MAAVRHLGFWDFVIFDHTDRSHSSLSMYIPNLKFLAQTVQKLWHLLYLPSVWPYLAWDMKPEVDCRVMRLPVSILTSYSDFSGSYSYLKVSLKILSDDVLRTLPLERSHVRRKLTKISVQIGGAILRVFTPKWEVNINSCHSHPQKALPWPERHLLRYSA